jgi:hypothetical protein
MSIMASSAVNGGSSVSELSKSILSCLGQTP